MKWVAACLFLFCTSCGTVPLKGYQLNQVNLEYRNFNHTNKIPELFGRTAKEGLAVTLDSRLFSCGPVEGYWEADVHSLTDTGQYRLVGLLNELGLKYHGVSVSYEHHSQHLLDASPDPNHFPVQDALLVRFVLYKR